MTAISTPSAMDLSETHARPLQSEDGRDHPGHPVGPGEVLPPITVMESADGFRILVPVRDVNLRHVWIFATPRSISIEIRSRSTIAHSRSSCKEIDDQRIVRELKLPAHITEGSTSVRPIGNDLEIVCVKEPNPSDRNWAEMLRFDTRTSLGCI